MSSAPVTRNWKVYINSVEYGYISLDFTKTHPSEYPDTFSIVLAGTHTGINRFDSVEVKKDDVTRFYGYVEDFDWDSNKDTMVSGRCRKLVTWKKWTERFIESRKDLAGFFGYVDGAELFKFLLRCPISDFPTEEEENWDEYPRHKVGWGMNSKSWKATSNSTSQGTHPSYTILRLMEFFWRNRGTDSTSGILIPSSGTSGDWTDVGAAGVNCINDCDATPDVDYIQSPVTNKSATGEYGFTDLGATATGINSAKLKVRMRSTQGWWQTITVKVKLSDGNFWYTIALETMSFSSEFHEYIYDVTYALNTVTKVNAAKVQLLKWSGANIIHTAQVSCVELLINYVDSGTIEDGDYFSIDFDERKQRVCGILVQSRATNDQYPENYCIDKFIDTPQEDFTDGLWTEWDIGATGHVNIASATHIDHDQFRDEETGVYKDFGAGYFTDFVHTFRFKVENPIPDNPDDLHPMFCPYALSNSINDLYYLFVNEEYLYVYVLNRNTPATGPYIGLAISDGTANDSDQMDADSPYATAYPADGNINGDMWYYCTITKSGKVVTCEIVDEDGVYVDTLEVAFTTDTAFRYIWAGNTWDNTDADDCDGDIELFDLGDWSELVCETNHSCQDILHSWQPTEMDRIRIRSTAQDLTRSWQISQLYIYQSDIYKYCVVEET